MKKLTVFAMTKKGYAVVKTLAAHYPRFLDAVVSARDKNNTEDYYDEIAALCGSHEIPFYNRKDPFTVRT